MLCTVWRNVRVYFSSNNSENGGDNDEDDDEHWNAGVTLTTRMVQILLVVLIFYTCENKIICIRTIQDIFKQTIVFHTQ